MTFRDALNFEEFLRECTRSFGMILLSLFLAVMALSEGLFIWRRASSSKRPGYLPKSRLIANSNTKSAVCSNEQVG